MKRSLFAWGILALLVMTQFTNCDVYTNNGAFMAASTCGSLCDGDANADLLEVKVNIPDTPSNFVYPSSLTQFDIGGACNEGGYVNNVVTWKLVNSNQATIRESQVLALNGLCKWGRFSFMVDTGVALTTQHTLVVEILGIDKDGLVANNVIVGRNTIYLNPQ